MEIRYRRHGHAAVRGVHFDTDKALIGIDLTQVRVEDVKLAGLPRFLGLSRLMDQKGMTLPDLPLMTLPADRLRQSDVAYEATGVGVGFTGLNIDIVPR